MGAAAQRGDEAGREQRLQAAKAPAGASQAPRAGRPTPFTGSSGTSTLARNAATLDPTALALGELFNPHPLFCSGRGRSALKCFLFHAL